jgi:hypothetical protein
MHIFNVSITTVQGLKNVSLKVWEELITQKRCRLFKTFWKKWPSSTTCKFFEKYPNTSIKSHAHLQCVLNNYARFEECQLKGLHKVGTLLKTPAQHSPFYKPDAFCATRPKNLKFDWNWRTGSGGEDSFSIWTHVNMVYPILAPPNPWGPWCEQFWI